MEVRSFNCIELGVLMIDINYLLISSTYILIGGVLSDVIKLGPSKLLYSPDYPNDIPRQSQKEWR